MDRTGLRNLEAIIREPQGYREATETYLTKIGAALKSQGITLIRQPSETLDQHGFTLAKYNTDPVNIAKNANKKDARHMNALYGKLCLEEM